MIGKSVFLLSILLLSMTPGNRTEDPVKKPAESNFRAGEELVYSLKYGIIHGGNASLTLRETRYRNKPVLHAKASARSVGLTDKLFRIDDVYESYFDPETCLPYKSIRNISEGGYKYYNEVTFAHADSSLYSKKSGHFKVPPDILDVVSSLYYLRRMDLDTIKKGDVIPIVTFFGDEIFPFPLRYKGKEIVKTKLGSFRCHRFDPVVEVGRIFDSEDDMTVWISADKNMVPIRVRFDMIVGAVLCDLHNYKNLTYALQRAD
jgi:hypothetical protein